MIIPNATAMESLGGSLANLEQGFIHLCGDLGTGKTTLVRGFLRALGYEGIVKSPTYTIVEPYYFDKYTVYHFDLYRLGDPEELEYLGIRDYLNGICLIEWPEKGQNFTPKPDIKIYISHYGTARFLEMRAYTEIGKKLQTYIKSIPCQE
ncbi:tRNA (adenosine(37)-N6)-threonylcarbamoyltransferase complex ATPase subunit type 1 TsaE [Thiotrichales bacterium HSG1]|nr:tRNA (adenosine(37)-N6)-threonylcarbamoyltransferase complex ATPase subunit type 1 TsaE [Thiotrichales bacterium HSG1]